MHWWRMWHGFSNSPKWSLAANRAGCSRAEVITVVVYLMEMASVEDDRGSIDGFDLDECEAVTGVTRDVCGRILEQLSSLSKPVIEGQRFKNWEKHQPKDRTATERKRLQRDRERQSKQLDSDCDVTNRHASIPDVTRDVTPREDTDTDKKEKTTKKEIADSSEFLEFWQAYPRKEGKGKARARFQAARRLAEFDEIMSALKIYVVSVSGKESQFIAHPATWLHQERWTDDLNLKRGKPASNQTQAARPRDPDKSASFDRSQIFGDMA